MFRFHSTLATLTLALILTASATYVQAQTYPYQITDLGTLAGADKLWAIAVSDTGYVAGYTEKAPYGVYHAFRWSNGVARDLGTLGGNTSRANGVNNTGKVAGESQVKNGQARAFLYDGAKMVDLTGKASSAYGINNTDRVVGDIGSRAFTWKANSWNYLPGLTGATGSGHANAVNDNDLIVGSSPNAAGLNRAIVWQNGVISVLAQPVGFTHSKANAVNNNGVVAGNAYATDWWDGVPVLWINGLPQMLPLAEGTYGGSAYGIDMAGHVLGIFDTDPAPNAISVVRRYWDGTAWQNPNDLVDPAAGWYVGAPMAISNNGNMAGVGGHPAGTSRSFLMTPIP